MKTMMKLITLLTCVTRRRFGPTTTPEAPPESADQPHGSAGASPSRTCPAKPWRSRIPHLSCEALAKQDPASPSAFSFHPSALSALPIAACPPLAIPHLTHKQFLVSNQFVGTNDRRGNFFAAFSNRWKNFVHSFQSLELFAPLFSNRWKLVPARASHRFASMQGLTPLVWTAREAVTL